MSKALNIIGGLAILWIILHGMWNVGSLEWFSGDLKGGPYHWRSHIILAFGSRSCFRLWALDVFSMSKLRGMLYCKI